MANDRREGRTHREVLLDQRFATFPVGFDAGRADIGEVAGAQAVAWISVKKKSFSFTRGKPKHYRTPTKAWRILCPTRGMSLTYKSPKQPADIEIMTGGLDRPEKFPPKRDFLVKEQLPWASAFRAWRPDPG
jgi:hypothetical protein